MIQDKRNLISDLFVVIVCLLAIIVGSGCKNVRSIDAGFGGLEVEYWPSHPSQEDKSIFDFSAVTNRVNTVPAGWNGPVLMQRR
tara:strand:- start:155 stop:406 length:252 start_codon:yes stop_codon:yes gene_type:complete